MNPNFDHERQQAHALLDQLGPGQLAAVVHLLETMISPEEDGDTKQLRDVEPATAPRPGPPGLLPR
jgi:hypothetical protein